jgi:hypothetical protein
MLLASSAMVEGMTAPEADCCRRVVGAVEPVVGAMIMSGEGLVVRVDFARSQGFGADI